METIVFINTFRAGSSRAGLKSAKSLGYNIILFSNQEKYRTQKKAFQEVDEIIVTNLTDMENLRVQIQNLKDAGHDIKAIISLIDPYVSTAVQLSREFCNSNVSLDAIKKMEDKIQTRKALIGTPYNNNFLTSSLNNDFQNTLVLNTIKFPAVVKFPNSCGSKHVYLIKTSEEYQEFIESAKKEYTDQELLIEEYVDGDQYLIEVIVDNGRVLPAAVIKQDISRGKRFIIQGYTVITNIQEPFYQNLIDAVKNILKTIGMQNGTCHLELRLKGENWKVIEINPRISGGAMNQMIKTAYGFNLAGETVKFLLGQKYSLDKITQNNIYTYYITSKTTGIIRRITGKTRALRSPGVLEVKFSFGRGNKVRPPLCMGHRLGYVIAKGSTIEEAKKRAIRAAKKIKIHLTAENDSTKTNTQTTITNDNQANTTMARRIKTGTDNNKYLSTNHPSTESETKISEIRIAEINTDDPRLNEICHNDRNSNESLRNESTSNESTNNESTNNESTSNESTCTESTQYESNHQDEAILNESISFEFDSKENYYGSRFYKE